MDRISKDRDSTASSDEIHAAHNVAGTTALDPLGRESEIAKALEKFLGRQSQSGNPFTKPATWAVATSLAHLETCLAIHEGDPEAKLAEDEESQIEQLVALAVEYKPAKEDVSIEPADAKSDEFEEMADDELAEIDEEPLD